MEWQLAIGIAAGVLQVIATIPYILSILRGTTRPNLVSWSLWTITVLITLVAQLSAGLSWSSFLLIGATLCNLSIVLLCLRGYGFREFGSIDVITLVLVAAAAVGWLVSSAPIIAMVFAVAADCIAYAPTLAKMYRDPSSEQALYWGLLVLADMLALISVTVFAASNIVFPIAYGIMNGAGFLLLLFRRNIWQPKA